MNLKSTNFYTLQIPIICFSLINASNPHTAAASSKGKTYFAYEKSANFKYFF